MKVITVKKVCLSLGVALGFAISQPALASYIAGKGFATEADATKFCQSSSVVCHSINANMLGGYTVRYEEAQGPSSGPKRGDGDGDPIDG